MTIAKVRSLPAVRRASRRFVDAAFAACALLLVPPSLAAQPSAAEIDQAQTISRTFEKVAEVITPSVVNIVATVQQPKGPRGRMGPRNDPFFNQFREFFGEEFAERFGAPQGPDSFGQQGMGTGVIIDSRGYILTNNHVIGRAEEVSVRTHDDKTFKAEVVGTDPRTDLAVIKLKGKPGDLPVAQLGDSDTLRIGEWVVACGNPFGLSNTITAGIVSAKGRSLGSFGQGHYEDFIQTDAAINPGNSGGPLVNLRGEVVGINTAIFSKSGGYMGIGFAIPINMAKMVKESLIRDGKVTRGWLGVGIQNLTEDLAESFNYPSTEGALVGHVERDGPGDKAGLRQGDIIVSLNEKKIRDINMLRNFVATLIPGSTGRLEIVREGRKESLEIKIGELPSEDGPDREEDREAVEDIGISVETLTPDVARRLGTRAAQGAIVTAVKPGSAAAEMGLMPRDVILSVNGDKVADADEFEAALRGADLDKGIRMVVENQGMERFVFLRSSSND